MRIYCCQCVTRVKGRLMKHYRNEHPLFYIWALRVQVSARRAVQLAEE